MKKRKLDQHASGLESPTKHAKTLGNSISSSSLLCDDTLTIVLSFLNYKPIIQSCLLVNKNWHSHSIQAIITLNGIFNLDPKISETIRQEETLSNKTLLALYHDTKRMFEEKQHLQLFKKNCETLESMDQFSDVVDQATWMQDFLFDEFDNRHRYKDVLEYVVKCVPFGSPLFRGTFEEQYHLVREDIKLDDYVLLVKELYGVHLENDDLVKDYLYFTDCIDNEKQQASLYFKQLDSLYFDSEEMEKDDDIFINDDDYQELSEHEIVDESNGNNEDNYEHGLRGGIGRLTKRGGVLYFEPNTLEYSVGLLKEYIRNIVTIAHETKIEQELESIVKEPCNARADNHTEQDTFIELGQDDHKNILTEYDISRAVRIFQNRPIYGILTLKKEISQEPPIEESTIEDLSGEDTSEEDNTSEELSEDEISEEELQYLEFELEKSTQPQLDHNDDDIFINDDYQELSEHDPLREKLIQVSIKCHEEVYGIEKTHSQKLFLKNWMGNGPLFYSHCASHLGNENPSEEVMKDWERTDSFDEFCPNDLLIDLCGLEENYVDEESIKSFMHSIVYDSLIPIVLEDDQIKKDALMDVAYFGYSLYDDEETEFPELFEENHESSPQSTVEQAQEYHLRRLLRQESHPLQHWVKLLIY